MTIKYLAQSIPDYRMKCMDCGAEFEHARIERDCYDPGEWNTEYTYEVCPECGSDYIAEGHNCADCGEFAEEGEELCEACKHDTEVDFCRLMDSFSPARLAYIDEFTDGKYISEVCGRRVM